jgi:hypothetical protein
VRAAHHLAQVVRAAGETRSELRQDQPEPLAIGPPHDVLDEVDGNCRGGLLDRDRPAPVRRQAAIGASGLAIDEVFADQ